MDNSQNPKIDLGQTSAQPDVVLGDVIDEFGGSVIEEVVSSGEEAAPVLVMPSDMLEALEVLNRERDEIFGLAEESSSETPVHADMVTDTVLVDYVMKNGAPALLNMVAMAMHRAGYFSTGDGAFVHRKSGLMYRIG